MKQNIRQFSINILMMIVFMSCSTEVFSSEENLLDRVIDTPYVYKNTGNVNGDLNFQVLLLSNVRNDDERIKICNYLLKNAKNYVIFSSLIKTDLPTFSASKTG